MVKILWLNRHKLTEEQVEDLRRVYGNDIEIISTDKSVKDWKEVVELGADCDVLAGVFPPDILADLVNPRNNQKPVIRARADRVATGRKTLNPATGAEEAEYFFLHDGWEQVMKIEFVTRLL